MKIENVATAYIVNPRNEILLIRHKRFKVWMPPGGHQDPCDNGNIYATLMREVAEESGLTIQDSLISYNIFSSLYEYLAPFRVQIEFVEQDALKDKHQHLDFCFCIKLCNSFYIKLCNNEDINKVKTENNAEYCWLSLEQLKKLPCKEIWDDVRYNCIQCLEGDFKNAYKQ